MMQTSRGGGCRHSQHDCGIATTARASVARMAIAVAMRWARCSSATAAMQTSCGRTIWQPPSRASGQARGRGHLYRCHVAVSRDGTDRRRGRP
jgi:hypothetical protein